MLDKLNTVLLVLLFAFVAAVWGQSSKTQDGSIPAGPEIGRYAVLNVDRQTMYILDTATGRAYFMGAEKERPVFGVIDLLQGSIDKIGEPITVK